MESLFDASAISRGPAKKILQCVNIRPKNGKWLEALMQAIWGPLGIDYLVG